MNRPPQSGIMLRIEPKTGDRSNDRREFFPLVKVSVEPAQDQRVEDRQAVFPLGKDFSLAIDLIRVDESRKFRFVKSGPQVAGPPVR